MSREKALVKNTAVIALGKISTQFVSFLLLPLYTTVLTTKEYGTVDVFNTYISLVLPIATLMIEQGAFRYLIMQEGKEEIARIISSSLIIVVGLNALFVVLGMIFFPYYQNDYKYFLIPLLISASIQKWCLQVSRGFKKLSLYSLGSVISASTTIVLNVVFIAILGYGARGMLIATSIGNTVGTVYLFFKLNILSYFSIAKYDKKIAKEMLSYSFPLIPNTLSLWIINSSDRAIVNYFLGDEANGILAVSHKFPALINTIYNIFQLSWHEFGTVHWNDADRDALLNTTINAVYKIFACLGILCISILPIVFKIMVPNSEYAQSYMTIPIYVVAVLINIMIGLLGVVYVADKRTKEIAKTTALAGAINIIFHIVFISFWGLYASAISTLVAYFVAMLLRIKKVRHIFAIQFDGKSIITIVIVSAATISCYYSRSLAINMTCLLCALLFSILFCKDYIYRIIVYLKMRFFGK